MDYVDQLCFKGVLGLARLRRKADLAMIVYGNASKLIRVTGAEGPSMHLGTPTEHARRHALIKHPMHAASTCAVAPLLGAWTPYLVTLIIVIPRRAMTLLVGAP